MLNETNKKYPLNNLTSTINAKLLEALKDIKYGSVTLVIQDGHIIQIDKSQKIRLI